MEGPNCPAQVEEGQEGKDKNDETVAGEGTGEVAVEKVPAGAGDATPPAPVASQQADRTQDGSGVEKAHGQQSGGHEGRHAQEN